MTKEEVLSKALDQYMEKELRMDYPRHSSFEYPVIGTVYPKGTTFKKNKDGTLTPIYPKDSQSQTE